MHNCLNGKQKKKNQNQKPSQLTQASSKVENGKAYSADPGTTSSLASAPKARTSLAAQLKRMQHQQENLEIKVSSMHKSGPYDIRTCQQKNYIDSTKLSSS